MEAAADPPSSAPARTNFVLTGKRGRTVQSPSPQQECRLSERVHVGPPRAPRVVCCGVPHHVVAYLIMLRITLHGMQPCIPRHRADSQAVTHLKARDMMHSS